MIPLQTTLPVKKFPKLTSSIVVFLFVLDLLSRFWPGARSDFLLKFSWSPESGFLNWQSFGAFVFHPHFFSLSMQLLFIWVFTPKLFERRGILFAILLALTSIFIVTTTYSLLHPHSTAAMLMGECIVGAWLGAYMRRDIWGTVNTFVIGPGWARVLEVPSYVQLFFWFFYQLISNLFLYEPFADAPMPYWIGFCSFLWGFLLDSLVGVFFANRNSPTQNHL